MYTDKLYAVANVGAEAPVDLSVLGTQAFSKAFLDRFRLQQIAVLVTSAVSSSVAPVVQFFRRPLFGSDVGRVLIGSITIPSGTAAGKVVYKSVTDQPYLATDFNAGEQLVYVVSSGTDINLGAATGFGIVANSTITNVGTTVVNGNLALYPGSSVTGFPPGVVTGVQDIDNAAAIAAQASLVALYANLVARPFTTDESGIDLGTLTLGPGVYKYSAAATLTGTLHLNAGGDPNAVFVFQIGSTLTTAAASSVVLSGGAQAGNVYWAVGSSATIGATSAMQGQIIAQASISMGNGSSSNGVLGALTAAVTLAGAAGSVVNAQAPSAGGMVLVLQEGNYQPEVASNQSNMILSA